jgi:RimJ/RimL family protein N-acetyltransferase
MSAADNAGMGHPLWPLFDVRVRVEDLELRVPTDDDLVQLAAIARSGIHPADEMPFAVPWTDAPSPLFERGFVQYHWSTRASWRPSDWNLELAVAKAGRLVGIQGMGARDFAVLRTVNTGSWLGREFQRQGIGRLMRQAILGLAFDRLGAEIAASGAFRDNIASSRVSAAIGYEPNGIDRVAPRGSARDMQRYRLAREQWRARPRPEIAVEGLDGCLDLFGVTARGVMPPGK